MMSATWNGGREGAGGVRRGRESVWRSSLAASGVLMALYLLIKALKPGSEEFLNAFSNVSTIVAALWGTGCVCLCAWRAAFPDRRLRCGWRLLALSMISTALAEVGYFVEDTLLQLELSPAYSDFFYILFYPLAFAGLAWMFAASPRAPRGKTLLDSALLASGAAALSWVFVLRPLWNDAESSLLARVVAVSYPMGDLLLLWAAVALVMAGGGRQIRACAGLLALGLALWGVTDLCYAYLEVQGRYRAGAWIDMGWPLAYVVVGLAALLTHWSDETRPHDHVANTGMEPELFGWRTLLWPILFAGAALFIIGAHSLWEDHALSVDVLLYFVTVLLVLVARQIITLKENERMALDLRAFSQSLEVQVEHRTRQVNALLQLTQSLNTTLDEDEVLFRAVDGARRATEAEAALIWLGEPNAPPSLRAHIGLSERPDWLAHLQALNVHSLDSTLSLEDGDWRLNTAPVAWNGRTMGTLAVVHRGSWREESARLLESLLKSVAVEVGTALQNARMFARAVHAADRDSVTGLLNHRAIQERYEVAFERARSNGMPLSVVMMDMNDFKFFNDTYGHPEGDRVLQTVARVLLQNVRAGDFVARYGGDEFMMVLPGASFQSAQAITRRACDALLRDGFVPEKSLSFDALQTRPISLSFGIASFPDDADSRLDLLEVADQNLYKAKRATKAPR